MDGSISGNLVSTCNVRCAYKSEDIDLNAKHHKNFKYHVSQMFKSSASGICGIWDLCVVKQLLECRNFFLEFP